MDRETKELKITKHTFAVKTYATAREVNAIQSAYFTGAKVEVVGQEPKIREFNPSVQYTVQLEMVKQMVTAMDGTAESIVERCEELPNDTFQELADALDALVSKKKS